MSLFAPEAPESQRAEHVAPMVPPADGPPPRRGVFGWMQRSPRRATCAVAALALVAGIGIGGASADQQAALDAANVRADRAENRVRVLGGALNDVKGKAETAEDRNTDLVGQLKTLRAKGEVPSFVGLDISDAEGEDAVANYDWNVKTARAVSDQAPGTVIGQVPSEGTVLKAGRSVTLTVAKKAPPKPKQWVTVKSLSGASSTKTPEFTIPPDSKARLVYEMPGDGNNAIVLYKAPDEYVDLMLNEIGPQSGTTRIYNEGTYYLDVSGAYEISLQVFKRP